MSEKEQNTCDELLARLAEYFPGEQARRVLSDTIQQLNWVQDMPRTSRQAEGDAPLCRMDALPQNAVVACPGVLGAYTHMAAEKLFPRGEMVFLEEFSDVAQAVLEGRTEFGVLPVENSSAGQVSEVLKLVSEKGLYICASTEIKVEHCLCIHPETDPDTVTMALSHPQGLAQCQDFLRRRGLRPERYSNTSTAARKVGEAPGPMACVCSRRSADLYRLRILEHNIQDYDENYTRFLCVSTRNILLPGADTISLVLSFPHEPGYLNKILTRFAACNLDLSRLLSMPIASRDFSVRFFLDFHGRIDDPQVDSLLSALYGDMDYFRFLGNFSRLP